MSGVNGEIDSPHRRQDLTVSPESPGHVRGEANNRTISLRDEHDRLTERASHMLPAKELAGCNALDIARPPSKGRLQHFEDAGLILRCEASHVDRAIERRETRRHRQRTIPHIVRPLSVMLLL
jgi:hypothetical protein